MYLGDNLLRDGITDLVEAFRCGEPDALILLTQVPIPWRYGVAELDGDRIVRLVEKPKDPPSNMALVGVYLFGSHIFDAARAIEPSARGELEITDAIQHLIDDGSRVESHTVKGWWKDTGQLADMLEANRLVLEDMERSVEGELTDAKVEGRVQIAAGRHSRAIDHPRPGDNRRGRRIVDSYIGPYTSIDDDVTIERSEIEHSIILSGCTARPRVGMEASLLGRKVKLTRGEGIPARSR